MTRYFTTCLNKLMKKGAYTPEKKSLWASYAEGIFDMQNGESYNKLLGYFIPEFIASLVLYAIIPLIDARWIANLKSTSLYATMGVTNTLLHFIIKTAEGFSVGTVILVGMYNGKKEYDQVGKTVASAFWVTVAIGGLIGSSLYLGAHTIYTWYGVPAKMVSLGTPILRLRAIGIFFMFVCFGLIGFFRGIKKPKIAMYIFILGACTFLCADYLLIFGIGIFPRLGILGSAWASIIQYAVMLVLAIGYLFVNKENRQYSISLLTQMPSWEHAKTIIRLSLPVVFDKAIFAAAYIWLGWLINPMGKYAIASYQVIRDLERVAIQPAAAFAQVITYLVSNAFSIRDWQGIKSNIKKTVFLGSLFVFGILILFSLYPRFFIKFFDLKGKFTDFSASLFPMISVFVFFDLLQLILSGALRGAANVNVVMMTRLTIFVVWLIPILWIVAVTPFQNQMVQFFFMYSAFYFGSGLMSFIYIWRFRSDAWKNKTV